MHTHDQAVIGNAYKQLVKEEIIRILYTREII